jgi:transcriptional regulator with XRE-family HTH domain
LHERKTKLEAQRERWNRAVVAIWSATRRDLDLTQQQVADKLGWSRATLAGLESGRRKVEVADLILFGQAVGVDPETLFRRVLRW